jgi:transposase-like protein
MAQEAEISRRAKRLTHRTYSVQFKAELVAACQVPGASIAALAGQNGMNANVLHRWLKEYQREGRHQLKPAQSSAGSLPAPAFVPLSLSSVAPWSDKPEPIVVELCKGQLTLHITWPASAASDLASWTVALLK